MDVLQLKSTYSSVELGSGVSTEDLGCNVFTTSTMFSDKIH